jgi:hypothetical protein
MPTYIYQPIIIHAFIAYIAALARSKQQTFSWSYFQCPTENECENNHSQCRNHEICFDLLHGYSCQCEDGYKRRYVMLP